MLWINFLHFYQPANADGHVIKEAVELSYKRIAKALADNPKIKFTLNISGCLLLRWQEMGYNDLIRQYARLLKDGHIELTGTAAYHPLLPLIHKDEAIRQTKENEKILKDCLGFGYKPRGYYLPEMAYGSEIAKTVKYLGYEWIILDEISYNGLLQPVSPDKKYVDKNSGLKVVFRSRQISSTYLPIELKKIAGKNTNQTIITATDGELYGLRFLDPKGLFENILKNDKIKTATISNYLDSLRLEEIVSIAPSNWESEPRELAAGVPYFLWQNPKNKIHQEIWELASLAYKAVDSSQNDINFGWARWHLVRGLSSCSFWWASSKDFRHVFGPYAWNPDEIERGVNELIRSVRALEDPATREIKIKAEKLYIKIKQSVWQKHWTFWKSELV